MTDAEIDAMTAGRELDALVAVKVMGWKSADPSEKRNCGIYAEYAHPGRGVDPNGVESSLPYYSNDMANAMPVFDVIKMWRPDDLEGEQDESLIIGWSSNGYYAAWVIDEPYESSICRTTSSGKSMAEAVCKVALKAALKLGKSIRRR